MYEDINYNCCHEGQLSPFSETPGAKIEGNRYEDTSFETVFLFTGHFLPPTSRILGSQRKEENIFPATEELAMTTCSLSLGTLELFPNGKHPHGLTLLVILLPMRREGNALKDCREEVLTILFAGSRSGHMWPLFPFCEHNEFLSPSPFIKKRLLMQTLFNSY